ncbi:MAG: hypothetical protein HC840_25885 [Leptolyngbyaceae cyanobacterium RM2_2_4]|nr:hypothetical protein [Leptolyngbyaceae cyanobacterium SM1_4_3]NJN90592.1 hypothetical protein [Leptolyngbyaceae cyanobacterium SL_5_14]NJO52256.1 hypothetical protein [Leptolyngbyaceae cyanobacterium RM2_2_4]
MPQRKRNSSAVTKAERRVEGLETISPTLDFANGFSLASYNEMLQDVKEKLAAHNQARSLVDKTQNDLLEAERALNDYSEHMLLNVASRYGKNSNEYEMAGGTRKSDRRRSRTVVSKTIPSTP